MQECHDSPLGGHLGKDKTIEQVKRRFYWSGMDAMIQQYVTSVRRVSAEQAESSGDDGLAASAADPDSTVAAGLDGLDHALPRSRSGNDAIVVFVDKLTKMVHLRRDHDECHRTAAGYDLHASRSFACTVCPSRSSVIAILDSLPTSGVHSGSNSARPSRWVPRIQPQTDGQTERANRTLEELLRSRTSTSTRPTGMNTSPQPNSP